MLLLGWVVLEISGQASRAKFLFLIGSFSYARCFKKITNSNGKGTCKEWAEEARKLSLDATNDMVHPFSLSMVMNLVTVPYIASIYMEAQGGSKTIVQEERKLTAKSVITPLRRWDPLQYRRSVLA